jgi:hypothetical protein
MLSARVSTCRYETAVATDDYIECASRLIIIPSGKDIAVHSMSSTHVSGCCSPFRTHCDFDRRQILRF